MDVSEAVGTLTRDARRSSQAFGSISVDDLDPVFQRTWEQGLIPDNMFSFYLPSRTGRSGELVLGGYDDAHFRGDITWVDLSSETYWEVSVDSIGLEDGRLSSCKTVIIDTGTSLLAGPKDEVDALANHVGESNGGCTGCPARWGRAGLCSPARPRALGP